MKDDECWIDLFRKRRKWVMYKYEEKFLYGSEVP